jgi:hypothetical protein
MQPLIDVASYRSTRGKGACFALFTLHFWHAGKFAKGELVDLYLFFSCDEVPEKAIRGGE